MLTVINSIDAKTIDGLFSVYSESMKELNAEFANGDEMRSSYSSFLKDFIANPKQLVLVEENNGEWVSALRAIEMSHGHWFFEAVETKPEARKKGYGAALLAHSIEHLEKIGMIDVACTISKDNRESQALHSKCGFIPTSDPPLNPWGELEEGTILYRYSV